MAVPGVRMVRFQEVLLAARRIAFYSDRLRQAGLDAPQAVAALRSVEEGLSRLPIVRLSVLLAAREMPRSPAGQRIRLPRGTGRLVVETILGEAWLCEPERERLWATHGLPVYEEIRGLDGELLASECEAHSGLHVNEAAVVVERRGQELVLTSLEALRHPLLRVATGLMAEVDGSLCGCGRPGCRISVAVASAAAV